MALSSPVLLVALRAPSQLGPEGDVDTGPHIARVLTPQPAEPVGRTEPSVKRKVAGSSTRVPMSRGLGHVVLSFLPWWRIISRLLLVCRQHEIDHLEVGSRTLEDLML